MRQEVRVRLKLGPEEAALLDNHSLLNLFNVMEQQLAELSQLFPHAGLKRFSRICLEVLVSLSRTGIHEHLPLVERHCAELQAAVGELLERHPEHADFLAGMLELIRIGHDRLREFNEDRFSWRPVPQDAFRNSLYGFLLATQRISRNRFSFIFAPDPPRGEAYWIEFRIGAHGEAILSPPVLHDIIRDLVGNARKYSDPGSVIRIELDVEGEHGLRLRVSDTGLGIPDEEIAKVVQFGYRATNVLDRRTMGGGFGLTKAYHLCKRCKGRFYIESAIGRGTTVELTLAEAT